VRLSHEQVRVIRDVVEGQIGESARVYLFGSRVDDAARGGDIDLYIECDEALTNRAATSARIAGVLQRHLGEQRIDVVIVDPEIPKKPVHRSAREHGVAL
jgi:predicted nucleotidyltransferase